MIRKLCLGFVLVVSTTTASVAADHLRDLQTTAINNGQSPVAHWGIDPDRKSTRLNSSHQ